jgi:predicted nucleotidyltransferase
MKSCVWEYAMPVATKQELLDRLRSQHQRLRELGLRRYGLFGSFVRDEAKADSDVDLLVEFNPAEKTFDNFMELAFFLEDLLGRRVEIVTPEYLSPYIGPHILQEVEYAALDA